MGAGGAAPKEAVDAEVPGTAFVVDAAAAAAAVVVGVLVAVVVVVAIVA